MERVEFSLGYSKTLFILCLIIHFIAIAILVYIPILMIFKILGAALLMLYGWEQLNVHAWRQDRTSIVKIWQDKSGRWGCKTKGGHSALGELTGNSYISPILMMLQFRLKSRYINVVIPVDAINPYQFRVLSTRLKFYS